MGLTAVGTLLMLVTAYVAQSPRLLKRLGLAGHRLDLRARSFTGYALALFLLAFGFFLAGVPLGPRPETEMAAVSSEPEDEPGSGAVVAVATAVTADEIASAPTPTPTPGETDGGGQPSTGAFAGPPPSAQTATAAARDASGEAAPETSSEPAAESSGAVIPVETPTATLTPQPTATPTATATTTPLPTLTPTPIFEQTAEVNTGTSTLWIRRTPGGRDLVLVRGGDQVILLPGHANQGGELWREVSTVDGIVGWIAEAYLNLGIEGASEVN